MTHPKIMLVTGLGVAGKQLNPAPKKKGDFLTECWWDFFHHTSPQRKCVYNAKIESVSFNTRSEGNTTCVSLTQASKKVNQAKAESREMKRTPRAKAKSRKLNQKPRAKAESPKMN